MREETMVSQDLLDILVCPACRTKVVLEDDLLACHGCGRRYPVRDGIPIMLIQEGDQRRVEPSAQPPSK